jgi:hypothetical protein
MVAIVAYTAVSLLDRQKAAAAAKQHAPLKAPLLDSNQTDKDKPLD